MKRLKYFTLAALVAFAACGEDEVTPVEETITGTISGVVTIEGVGQSGISVSLSSGATATTDGSGSYSFASVEAGAYTVTISGFASDATFSSTSKAASISTDGQVVQVNFDGQYVRTSAIFGAVSAGGSGLQGVSVSIGSASTTTDANGQYNFVGLRAGSYTVTISGFDASMYIFGSTSQTVTLGVGESGSVSFSGQLATTANISGQLFIDELPKNDAFDSSEDALAVAGVAITLEKGPGNTETIETDENGAYSFAGLAAGSYRVYIASTDTDIPAAYAFGGLQTDVVVQVTVGQTAAVNWPFDIVKQSLTVGAFLGRDDPKAGAAGVAPLKNIVITLYPTETDLTAGTNDLGTDTTGADGYATFVYDRKDDTSPQGGQDHIVFAKIDTCLGSLCPDLSPNGETVLEISYDATQAETMAPDVFDYLYNKLWFSFSGQEIDGDSLNAWDIDWQRNDTTLVPLAAVIDVHGDIVVNITGFAHASKVDTFYVHVDPTGGKTNGHKIRQTPVAEEDGTAVGSYLSYVWNGTILPSDTIRIGYLDVKYLDSDVVVRAHHEADDTLGFTLGDNFAGNGVVQAWIEDVDNDTIFPITAFPTTDGKVTFADVLTDSAYTSVAQLSGPRKMLTDARVDFTLDGSDQVVNLFEKATSTYYWKYTNGKLQGHVWASDESTKADSVLVTVAPADNNIGSTWTRTMTVGRTAYGAGNWATPDSLMEGPYVITVADLEGKWVFVDTDTLLIVGASSTAPAPFSGPSSGSADNKDERTAVRDLEDIGAVEIAHFMATRTDGKIRGVVANDRDYDGNTIDPGEALEGAQIGLYTDYGSSTKQVLHMTSTTDANGAYSFNNVMEYAGVAYDDRAAFDYTVAWITDTPSNATVVLRSLTSTSVNVDVTAAAPTVGTTSPTTLPAWDYNLTEGWGTTLDPAHFAFLVKNTTVRGTITDTSVPAKAVAGMTVSLRRCNDSVGAVGSAIPNPPRDYGVDGLPDNAAGGDDKVSCNGGPNWTSAYLGTTQNATTNSSGVFEFAGLTEGVYEVIPQPTTVGIFTTSTPAARLYFTLGSGDIESATFTVN